MHYKRFLHPLHSSILNFVLGFEFRAKERALLCQTNQVAYLHQAILG